MGAGGGRQGERRRPAAPRRVEGLARPVLGPAAPAPRACAKPVATRTRPTSDSRRWWSATSSSGDPSSTADSPTAQPRPSFSGRTAWARSLQTPLREFLRTETGGAAVLLAAAVAALVWVNVDASSYDSLWGTTLSIDLGDAGVALDLRHWVNSGLMTFFFFVVGLEARREFDLGSCGSGGGSPCLCWRGSAAWRWRSPSTSPSTPAARPRTAGESRCRPTLRSRSACSRSSARAFPTGCARSCSRSSSSTTSWRSSIIATVYTETLHVLPLLVAIGACSAPSSLRSRLPVGPDSSTSCSGRRLGGPARSPGVEPVVIGARDGPPRLRLPGRRAPISSGRPSASASSVSSRRRSSPAPSALGLRAAVSPNERLQQLYHPWTSYVIVPLFALANAGIAIDGGFLARGLHLADHARDPRRLRGRQAGGHPRLLVAADAA